MRSPQEIRWPESRTAAERPPLRVGVFCSHRAPGLDHLLDKDPNRGILYDISCCLTSEDVFEEQGLAAAHGVPVITHPIRAFCKAAGSGLSDPVGRQAYDAVTVERVSAYELDLIVLASYLYVITEPLLDVFRHRIVNVHHSDLTVRDGAGRARFPGLRAVRDAIAAGSGETRATVHLVTRELDQGPPILRSWAFPVSPLAGDALAWRAGDMLNAYSYAHQEWMIRAAWGPLLAGALKLIATARVDLPVLAAPHAAGPVSPWDLAQSGALAGEGPLPAAPTLTVEAR
jgi:folate-dependent phosphoribosylglycinamide formyltransferase PurN